MRKILKNGTVFTMTENEPRVCDIAIEGGKIVEIGTIEAKKDDEIFDLSGKIVLPGLIDSHCHIGLFGTAMGDRGVDGNDCLSANMAHLRGIDGLNPFDEEFKVAYESGVTTVSTGPGSGHPINGTFVTMKTFGKTFDSQIINENASMKMAFGENPKSVKSPGSPGTRMGTAAIIREALFKAKRYEADKKTAEKENKPLPPFDLNLEALGKVVNREMPVKMHAHRADDILTALRIAKEFDLDITIEHCSEGYLIPEQLGYADGVIIGPLFGFPHKLEVKNLSFESGKILYENGVNFAIMSDLPAGHVSDIISTAGACVKAGLPMIEGLRAITITPAKLLKIADRLGSIEVGKDADITVFTGNPIEEVCARCVFTMVDGVVAFENLN